jgi:hypothetical protein
MRCNRAGLGHDIMVVEACCPFAADDNVQPAQALDALCVLALGEGQAVSEAPKSKHRFRSMPRSMDAHINRISGALPFADGTVG